MRCYILNSNFKKQCNLSIAFLFLLKSFFILQTWIFICESFSRLFFVTKHKNRWINLVRYNDAANVMDDLLHVTTMIPSIAGESICLTSTFHGIPALLSKITVKACHGHFSHSTTCSGTHTDCNRCLFGCYYHYRRKFAASYLH